MLLINKTQSNISNLIQSTKKSLHSMKKSLLITPDGIVKSIPIVFDGNDDNDISKVLCVGETDYDGESLMELEDKGYKLCVFAVSLKNGARNIIAEELYGRLKSRYDFVPKIIYGNFVLMDDDKSLEKAEWNEIRNHIYEGPKKLGMGVYRKNMSDFVRSILNQDNIDES